MSKEGRPRKTNGTVFLRKKSLFWWIRYRSREGKIIKESTGITDRQDAERFLRERLNARDEGKLPTILAAKNLTFTQWAEWFLEKRSAPPLRSEMTHNQNVNALKFLRPVFGMSALPEITSEAIEDYIRTRLCSGRRVHTKLGIRYQGKLKPATVHQEFRVLRRMLNIAVKQRRLTTNPCNAVEFPVSISRTTRKPYYLTSTEQARVEFFAPSYLKHAVVIISEMGLRPYKELMPMQKSAVDLENMVVHIPDSKTPSGIGDMPMSELARRAFKARIEETPGSDYLFPTPHKKAKKPYITSLKKTWATTLRRAGVPHFPLYHLRHSFATRLSAGGVADHFVTLMLRQSDSQVFKRYSQAKLNMMREALLKLDRQANEHQVTSGTPRPN